MLCSWLEGELGIDEEIVERPDWLHDFDILGLEGLDQPPYLPMMDKVTFSLVFSQH